MELTQWSSMIQITVGAVTISGTVFSAYKLIKTYVFVPITNHIKFVKEHFDKLEIVNTALNERVFPIIDSLNREFSVNSGKSIKDQISRIDNSVRLAELRSKVVASSFTNIGMYESDPDGNYVWVNKALEDMFGLSADSFTGHGWLFGVLDDEREEVLEKWKNSVKGNIPYDTEFTAMNYRTKEKYRVKTVAYPNRSVDGSILGYYGQITRI